jgi:ribosomal protein S18 acetylase RimI-like enzyme
MYKKELYVFEGTKPVKAVIRQYREEDFEGLIQVQQEAFPPPFPSELWWNMEQLSNHVRLFPEGALCIEINGRIAGSMTGLIVNYQPGDPDHNWSGITDDGYIRNHDPNGNTLYVVDICISPAFRKLGLGKVLMQSMYEVVVHLGLDRLLGGGRMPGYHLHSFLLRCGRTPVKPVRSYLEDEESCDYGMLMEWRNPFKSF